MSIIMSLRTIYAKRSKSLLEQTTMLRHLTDKALKLSRLQDRINLYLPTIMQENCAIASFKNNILTILTTHANWATRLRYQQNHLKQQLLTHSEFRDIERIIVKVFPKPLQRTIHYHSLIMSPRTAQVIKETAIHIQHPALKAALNRLATHGK